MLFSFVACREIFLEAEKHIIELMKKNSYPRFIQSEHYRNLLQNAPNPVPKKTYVWHSHLKTHQKLSLHVLLVESFILSKTITFERHRVAAKMNTIPTIQLIKAMLPEHLLLIQELNLNLSEQHQQIQMLLHLQVLLNRVATMEISTLVFFAHRWF